jgi:protein phosphatase
MRLDYEAVTTANAAAGHSVNEDAWLSPDGVVHQGECEEVATTNSTERVLFAVSDGIHCSPGAAEGSRSVLEALCAVYAENPAAPIGRKLSTVHDRFTGLVGTRGKRAGMTATLVAAEILGAEVTVYHVGDSTAWLVRGEEPERLTREHTILERMIDEGDISAEEAEGLASIYDGLDCYFTAAPGEEKPRHDQCSFEARDGDTLILASDGIESLDSSALVHHCRDGAEDSASAIVQAAIDAGSDDNVTVVVIHFRTED